MFAAVMALNAYSGAVNAMHSNDYQARGGHVACGMGRAQHTDLIQTTLVGEDGNVSVVAGASCERVQLAAAGGRAVRAAGAGNAPDMMAGCVVVFMCRGVVQLRSSRKLGVSFWAWVPVDGGRLSSTRYALRAAWSCRLSGKAIIARGRRDWCDWLPCLLGTSKNSPAPSHLASAFS